MVKFLTFILWIRTRRPCSACTSTNFRSDRDDV